MRPQFELGDTAKDSISGYVGVVTCLTFWLGGPNQIVLQARGLHEGKPIDSQTFDVSRCERVVE